MNLEEFKKDFDEKLANTSDEELLKDFPGVSMDFDEYYREEFEEKVFNQYFVKGIKFSDASSFAQTENNLYKHELLERDGDDYKRDDISAMWNGWRLAVDAIG